MKTITIPENMVGTLLVMAKMNLAGLSTPDEEPLPHKYMSKEDIFFRRLASLLESPKLDEAAFDLELAEMSSGSPHTAEKMVDDLKQFIKLLED